MNPLESLFTTTQNPTQRQSFVYAKKSPNGYYIVVEAIGGKNNPNVIPVMLLQFTEEKWNDMISSGMTLGELLFKNDTEKRNSLDVELNKKNRVIVAQFASKEAIANTPHSPRFNSIISQEEESVKKLFSQRNTESRRAILANALETVAEKEGEKKLLREYKELISEYTEKEAQLDGVNEELSKLYSGKGKRDMARINALRAEAQSLAASISAYDKRLLKLESMESANKF